MEDLAMTADNVNIQLHWFDSFTEGEAATIRCSVDHTCRSSPPSLQWNKPGQVKKKSVENYEGSWREESELTYIPSYVDDGSSVQCTATYPNGQRTERSRTLDINYSPKNVTITIIGTNEVIEGSDVTLQCNSFSKPDVHEYEWYKGKTRLPDRGREMTVYNVPGDMEPYSCTAINRVGRGESAPAEIPVLYSPKNVTITVIGMDEVIEGSDVTLQCNSFSKPDVYKYKWYKGKSRLPDRGRAMTVYNVTGDMEPYSCTAINRVGRGESAPAQIPVLHAAIGVHITVKHKREVTLLICDFLSSHPDVTHYTWMKDGSILPETGETLTLVDNEATSGQYSCIAHNSFGKSSANIYYTAEGSNHLILMATVGTIVLKKTEQADNH
ncbi:B-cell receptor CD22-like [Leptodactylus fuscus]